MDYLKHIWEGWTVQDFIDALVPQADMIMAGQSCRVVCGQPAVLQEPDPGGGQLFC